MGINCPILNKFFFKFVQQKDHIILWLCWCPPQRGGTFFILYSRNFLRLRLFQSDRVHALRRRSGGAAAITQKESDPLFFGIWSQVATASSHTQAKEHGVLCLEYDYDYAKPLCAALQPQFASGKSPGLNSCERLQPRRFWRLMRAFLLTDTDFIYFFDSFRII